MKAIEPFYFGASETQLLGCYHAPEAKTTRNCAVVLCYPMGHEYIQFHRACRQLAALLASGGFPVLRFDFYGCGDSSGASEDGRIHRWLDDISSAVSEIRHRSAAAKICLVGLRLGGGLAAMAGAGRQDIDGMVLWDPVVAGKRYLEELKNLHREMLRRAHLKPVDDPKCAEIAGFALTHEMISDLNDLDLLRIQCKPANDILVVESQKKPMQTQLTERLKSLNAEVKHIHLPNPQFWTWIEDFSHILVPRRILQAVTSWLSEVYP